MTADQWVVVIPSIAGMVAAIVAAINTHWGRQENEMTRQQMVTLEVNTNSRMDKMLELVRTAALAEGNLAGVAQERAATASKALNVKEEQERIAQVAAISTAESIVETKKEVLE